MLSLAFITASQIIETDFTIFLVQRKQLDISHKMTLSGAMMLESEAVWRVLVRKGLLTNDEILEEIKVVRRE